MKVRIFLTSHGLKPISAASGVSSGTPCLDNNLIMSGLTPDALYSGRKLAHRERLVG